MPLKIGGLQLATNLLLAPLAGYTDQAFRLVVRGCGGVGLGCTDLLSPDALLREKPRSLELTSTCDQDRPLAMQLFGGNVAKMCDAARWAEDHGADLVDINMGCPVDRITRQEGGSKLLCDPKRTVAMVEQIAKVLKRIPLTAKLRLGWNDNAIVAPQLAADLEKTGVALITIHGRTTHMQYTGKVRLEGIADVVAAVKSIPVVGNGDVRTPQDAQAMMQITGCTGVMIGRGALSSPWIFRDTWSYLTTGTIPPPPSLEQRCQYMSDHFHNMIRLRGERLAMIVMRRQVSWYAKQMNPCKILREGVRQMKSVEEFERVVGEFLEWRGQGGMTNVQTRMSNQ